MRSRIVNRLILRTPPVRRRSFHHASALAKDPPVFENSLERTLEVHRMANRASLIRRVVPRSAPRAQNYPSTPSEPARPGLSETQGQQLPKPTPSSARHQFGKSRKNASVFERDKEAKRVRESARNQQITHPFSFKVNAANNRPSQCPWIDEPQVLESRSFSGGLSQLEAEIRALQSYMAPVPAEQEAIDRVVAEVRDLVSSATESLKGFHVTYMGLPMDYPFFSLTFQIEPTEDMEKPNKIRSYRLRQYREALEHIRNIFKPSPTYRTAFLHGPSIPPAIIHIPTGIHFQIENPEAPSALIEYIHDFHAEYPTLEPLCIAIKMIVQARGLFIPSKTLQVLAAAFLKMNHGRFHGDTSCAESLIAFLQTFGTDVDLRSTGISASPPGFFTADSVDKACGMYSSDDNADGMPAYLRGQRSLINTRRTALKKNNEQLANALLVQSPVNYMKDLGRPFTETARLRTLFPEAHEALTSALESWEPPLHGISKETSILSQAFRANFNGFQKRRKRIIDFGEGKWTGNVEQRRARETPL
ncbi:hypothetical protein BDV19DRAFT_392301 [Aspergillus venezuelensis]